jgi:hypothetical protein
LLSSPTRVQIRKQYHTCGHVTPFVIIVIMSSAFVKLTTYSPDMIDVDGKMWNALEYLDSMDDFKARNSFAKEIEWLPVELKEMVYAHKSNQSDLNSEGEFNKERLTEAAQKLFSEAQKNICFVNFYQFKQFAALFASYWGFQLTTTESMCVKCFYQRTRKKAESRVSPSKQRKGSSIKGDCGFSIRARARDKNIPRHNQCVRIASFTLNHGDSCTPSLTDQCLAKRASGLVFASLDLKQMGIVVRAVTAGNVSAIQLRSMLREYIHPNVTITSNDLANFRMRAFKCNDGGLDHSMASKLLKFLPLQPEEIIDLDDSDFNRKKASELMSKVLDESGDAWKAHQFLQGMKDSTAGFDYRMHRNEHGRPSAIVWITTNMRNSWIRYGSTIFLDRKEFAPYNKPSIHLQVLNMFEIEILNL